MSRGGVPEPAPPKYVIAIDFGTTFSGAAYVRNVPMSVERVFTERLRVDFVHSWQGIDDPQLPKTRTCLLVPRGSADECEDWGTRAWNDYMLPSDDPAEYQRFRQDFEFLRLFKLVLRDRASIAEFDEQHGWLVDVAPRDCPHAIIPVIGMYLKELTEEVLEKFQAQVDARAVMADVRWVVTVPALWVEEQKAFMIRACEFAGMIQNQAMATRDRLMFVSEPEAGAIDVLRDSVGLLQQIQRDSQAPLLGDNVSLVVVDAGGGTIDLSAYRTVRTPETIRLRMLTTPLGSVEHGSSQIDQIFFDWVKEQVGPAVGAELETEEYRPHSAKFVSNFENAKMTFVGQRAVRVAIPDVLRTLFEQRHVQIGNRTEYVSLRKAQMEAFFEPSIVEIRRLLQVQFDTLRHDGVEDVKFIILIGGLGRSILVRDAVQSYCETLATSARVLISGNPLTAVVQGGAVFGLFPEIISERICPASFGIAVNTGTAGHPARYHIQHPGTRILQVVKFDPILQLNQAIPLNHVVTKEYRAGRNGQNSIEVRLLRFNGPVVAGVMIYAMDCHCESRLECPLRNRNRTPITLRENETYFVRLTFSDVVRLDLILRNEAIPYPDFEKRWSELGQQ